MGKSESSTKTWPGTWILLTWCMEKKKKPIKITAPKSGIPKCFLKKNNFLFVYTRTKKRQSFTMYIVLLSACLGKVKEEWVRHFEVHRKERADWVFILHLLPSPTGEKKISQNLPWSEHMFLGMRKQCSKQMAMLPSL